MKRGDLALVVAGGKGIRFGGPVKKQFAELRGEPVFKHSLKKLASWGRFAEIRLVVPEDSMDEAAALTADMKDVVLRAGGENRQESVRNGLQGGAFEHVVVHDGVRPLFSRRLFEEGMKMVETAPCVIPVVDIQDTVKEISGGKVVRTLDRRGLVYVQTPQFFDYRLLTGLHAEFRGMVVNDDSQLFELKKTTVMTIMGEKFNIKITTAYDLVQASFLLREIEACRDLE